jgi:hypothetical protein
MKIDWDEGKWVIWDIDTGAELARVETVRLRVPSELVNTDGGRHGWLVAGGTLTVTDNVATITKG